MSSAYTPAPITNLTEDHLRNMFDHWQQFGRAALTVAARKECDGNRRSVLPCLPEDVGNRMT